MSQLCDDYQEQFLQALYEGETDHPLIQALLAQPAFTVYRNTVLKGCVDALAANYPAILKLVGLEWFQGAALAYARSTPPDDVRLIMYGGEFPAFLSRFAPAQTLPYLADVATLDRYWTESHMATDDVDLDVPGLSQGMATDAHRIVLQPRASTRWHWSAEHPCYSIWNANRETAHPLPDELPWLGEGTLLTRIDGTLTWQQISLGACSFLDACAKGKNLPDAAQDALQAEPELDISLLLRDLIQAGAFTSWFLVPISED